MAIVIKDAEHPAGLVEQLSARLEAVERAMAEKADRDHGHEELLNAIENKADKDHTHPELATPAEIIEAVDELAMTIADDIEEVLSTEVSEVEGEEPTHTEIEEPPATPEEEEEHENSSERHAGMAW